MTDNFRYFLIYWLPVGLYCAVIFIQSAFPSIVKLHDIPFGDKYLHFIGYALLGFLFFRAFRSLPAGSSGPAVNRLFPVFLLSVAASTLFGISDEIHQAFVPYRSAEVMDALADMAGSCLGASVYYLLVKNLNIFEKYSWVVKFRQFL